MFKCNKAKFIGPVGFKVKSVCRKEEFGRALPVERSDNAVFCGKSP